MSETKLRAALIEARDWFESQAKAVSKGCGSSYELNDLREQRDALDAALADAPAQPLAAPDGWVLVPIYPTMEMRESGNKALDLIKSDVTRSLADKAYYAYEAMLKAAPQPPAPASQPVAVPAAWAATSEEGNVEALGMNQSRRFDTPLYTTPQPAAPAQPVAWALDAQRLTEASLDISTVLHVEGMDLEIGSRKLLKDAREAIDAARAARGAAQAAPVDAPAPSRYGSPELQALILAKACAVDADVQKMARVLDAAIAAQKGGAA